MDERTGWRNKMEWTIGFDYPPNNNSLSDLFLLLTASHFCSGVVMTTAATCYKGMWSFDYWGYGDDYIVFVHRFPQLSLSSSASFLVSCAFF